MNYSEFGGVRAKGSATVPVKVNGLTASKDAIAASFAIGEKVYLSNEDYVGTVSSIETGILKFSIPGDPVSLLEGSGTQVDVSNDSFLYKNIGGTAIFVEDGRTLYVHRLGGSRTSYYTCYVHARLLYAMSRSRGQVRRPSSSSSSVTTT